MSKPMLVLVLASTSVLRCSGPTTTQETETCRTHPLALEQNGVPFICRLDEGGRVTLRCAAGAATLTWDYVNRADFISEVTVPNRLRVETRTTTAGVLLGSFASTLRSYEYDGQGRLTRRLRTSRAGRDLGTFVLDDTRYAEWDASGRPIRGEVQSGELRQTVLLTYDDGRRRVESSTGETVTLDRDGSPVNELEVFGLGPDPFRSERNNVITETARVCLTDRS